MQPLQRAHLLLLLALLVLCMPLGQADQADASLSTTNTTSSNPVSNLSPPCGSPALLSLALGLAAAFFLRLR